MQHPPARVVQHPCAVRTGRLCWFSHGNTQRNAATTVRIGRLCWFSQCNMQRNATRAVRTGRLNIWFPSTSRTCPFCTAGSSCLHEGVGQAEGEAAPAGGAGRQTGGNSTAAGASQQPPNQQPAAPDPEGMPATRSAPPTTAELINQLCLVAQPLPSHHQAWLGNEASASLRAVGRSRPQGHTMTQSGEHSATC